MYFESVLDRARANREVRRVREKEKEREGERSGQREAPNASIPKRKVKSGLSAPIGVLSKWCEERNTGARWSHKLSKLKLGLSAPMAACL